MDFLEIRKLCNAEKNIGFSRKQVEEGCEKYGGLPEVLKQYYLKLGKHPLNKQQNYLFAPNEMIDTGTHLIFYGENQYVAQWAIKKEDIHEENPAVYCAFDEKNFTLECDNLYDFLCAMASFQAASWGLEYCSEEIYVADEEQLAQIEKKYQKKRYALHEWMEASFYGNCEEEVICVMGGEQVLYASSSQTCFEAMDALVQQLGLEVL